MKLNAAPTKTNFPLKENDKGLHRNGLNNKNKLSNNILKYALIIAGTFFTGLGILGIILPVLPTTPFLLLAAVCYEKSSQRFHHWLFNNRWLGVYIKNYHEKTGVSLKTKIISIVFIWITIGYSAFYVIDVMYGKIILILIAVGVTIHIISLRMQKHSKESNTDS
jgi:uncharacterized membrane protein YbaN (DUF454 family)